MIKPSTKYQYYDGANPIANQSPMTETDLKDPASKPHQEKQSGKDAPSDPGTL
jgi:hypothetical protein